MKESDDDIKRYFRYKLERLIKKNNISQSELAEEIGVSRQVIAQYLTGGSLPSFVTIKKLSLALNCSVEDFYYKN